MTSNFLTDTAQTVLKKRYYLKDADGNPVENWSGLCLRVANAVAPDDYSSDLQVKQRAEAFYQMIYNLDFLPNSPCLMNAGTDIGQLSACFVLPVPDSMDGIFDAIKNGALVHKTGGGTGYSFSRIRPKNSAVSSTQGVASGPLSFAAVFDAATETIKQGGKRRGANMGVLRIDHPDILEFIDAKKDPNKFNNFNFSVAVTDEFMQAVQDKAKYSLYDPTNKKVVGELDANDVFDKIIDGAWLNGEPGVLFIDTANRANPTPHLGDFEATNPCGEQFLLPFFSCNLGSINLSRYVLADGSVDWLRLGDTVELAVKFLDNVIEHNKFPLPEIEEATLKTRNIGLGIMGLHDFLIKQELAYDSKQGRAAAANAMQFIRRKAEEASKSIAYSLGAFPEWNAIDCKGPERRNAALTSIQPTGTVSMIADCASGCEPYFAVVTKKTVMDGTSFVMVNPLFESVARRVGFFSYELMEKIADAGTVMGFKEIPEHWQQIFKSAQDISTESHIEMQAILQNNGVDSSISKTINMPNAATKQDVREAYIKGYTSGCKGLTVYRDGSRAGQVLSTNATKGAAVIESKTAPIKSALPDVLNAKRYRLRSSEGGHIYIIVCFDDDEIPMEVFANFPMSSGSDMQDKYATWTTVCRLVSLSLRCKIDMADIIAQLERSSGHRLDLPAQLSRLLKSFMAGTQKGFSSPCPDCGGVLIFSEGCECCEQCGLSKCS